MIPFPGESVLVEDAADVTGAPDGTLWEDIAYRAGSRTLTAGDEWRALVYSGDMDYAEGPLDATVQWAIEVVSGAVTVTAAEGLDPSYADYGATLTTDLGVHTFTGPGTLLIDSQFTADQVADLDGSVSAALQLGLTATSGDAVVQQIKLRVWPVGGAHGAFVTQPGFDTTPVNAAVYAAGDEGLVRSGSVTTAGVVDSWDAAAEALASDTVTAPPYEFVNVVESSLPSPHSEGSAYMRGSQSNAGNPLVSTTLELQPSFTLVVGADWESMFPVGAGVAPGYIRPPEEVRDEAAAYLYPQIGEGSVGWVDAVATFALTAEDAATIPAVRVYAEAPTGPDLTFVGGGTPVYVVNRNLRDDGPEVVVPSAGETITTAVGLPTASRFIFLHVSHSAAQVPPEWPGASPGTPLDPAVTTGITTRVAFGQGDPDGVFYPTKTYAHMPDYRLWYPDAAPEVGKPKPQVIFFRTDGLGAGAALVYGRDTRQSSGLVYGNP